MYTQYLDMRLWCETTNGIELSVSSIQHETKCHIWFIVKDNGKDTSFCCAVTLYSEPITFLSFCAKIASRPDGCDHMLGWLVGISPDRKRPQTSPLKNEHFLQKSWKIYLNVCEHFRS